MTDACSYERLLQLDFVYGVCIEGGMENNDQLQSTLSFSKVISLGPSCETAYQIRQIVEQEEAYVFDWVIASARSVAQAVGSDFSGFIHPEALSLEGLTNADHPYILDRVSGIEFHHDFANDHDFINGLADVQAKFNYLINRMRSTLSSDIAVLFIHHLGSDVDAVHLRDAIVARFPKLKFRLLELTIGSATDLSFDDEIVFGNIPGYGTTWQERTVQWEAVLDKLLRNSYGHTLIRRDPATRDVA